MAWAATLAKAKFSEMLDKADVSPQKIERRKKRYILLTEEQYVAHETARTAVDKPFVSAWDALALSSGAKFDVEFPRLQSNPKWRSFEVSPRYGCGVATVEDAA